MEKLMIVKALHFCFQRLYTWLAVNVGDVDDVIIDIEPPNEPQNIEKKEACIIEGSTMCHKSFCISMKKILNFHKIWTNLLAYLPM
jgi:hypothetical protein